MLEKHMKYISNIKKIKQHYTHFFKLIFKENTLFKNIKTTFFSEDNLLNIMRHYFRSSFTKKKFIKIKGINIKL